MGQFQEELAKYSGTRERSVSGSSISSSEVTKVKDDKEEMLGEENQFKIKKDHLILDSFNKKKGSKIPGL